MHACKPVRICLVFSRIVFQAIPAKNAWPRPKSACAQVSTALLRPDRYICVGMDLQMICGLLAYKERVSDAISVKTLVPAVARSAGPAPLPLCHKGC